MNYILVTAIKNEEKNIESLILSILNQTIKPSLWLIINDGSIDNSKEIIMHYANHINFIFLHNLGGEVRDLTWRYHKIMQYGFNLSIKICAENNISWNYIGVLDGDIVISSNNYFEYLIHKFIENPKYGVLSGKLLSWNGSEFILEYRKKNKPTGAARLINREVLEKINGYPYIPTADGIILIKSELAGYENFWFEEIIAKQSRLTNSITNNIKLYKEKGFIFHYLGYSILYVLLYSIFKTIIKHNFTYLLIIYYFICNKIKKTEQVNDKDILVYKKKIIPNYIKGKLMNYFK